MGRKERSLAGPLFLVIFFGGFGVFVAARNIYCCGDFSVVFAGALLLRLLFPALTVAIGVALLRRDMACLSKATAALALLWTSGVSAFLGSVILIFGYAPIKYHSYPVPRSESIPFLAFSGAAILSALVLLYQIKRQRDIA